MKNIIQKILKEEVSDTQEKHQQKMVDILKREGFNGGTPYQEIIGFLNTTIGKIRYHKEKNKDFQYKS